ncbi:Glycosyl transferase, group 2 family protein [Chitinispirillum alkaliphilum]|nr:Glycosyl transferase, group 2 family protein [Chitinispirillum alkaliphilum]
MVFSRFKKVNNFSINTNAETMPKVSLLISAFNEEKVIRKKIENSLSLLYPSELLEIVVISDGSTDKTAEIAAGYEKRIKLIHFDKRKGKNSCINEALEHAVGEIVVFSDANSMYNPEAIRKMAEHFSNPRVGCVVGKEIRKDYSEQESVKTSDDVYWSMENRIKEILSLRGLVVVANGSIFAIRKKLFCALYNDVANDFQLPLEIGAAGYQVLFEPKAKAFEDPITNYKEEFFRKIRIVTRGLFGTKYMFHKLKGIRLAFFLMFKFSRWFTLHLLILNFLTSIIFMGSGLLYTVALLSHLFLYSAAVSGVVYKKITHRKLPKFIDIVVYFFMVSTAAFIAGINFLANKPISIWDCAKTNRNGLSNVHPRGETTLTSQTQIKEVASEVK